MTRGLMIAAPRSGSGKTLATLALLAALRRRGVAVRAAKSGPDYIDPAFHAAATGAPCCNLDSWAMPPDLITSLLAGHPEAALLVVEAAMGLFDGAGEAKGRQGRPADLARRFALPVLLVLDIAGQSQSAAATALGFARFEPGVEVAGVILNRAGSVRHRETAAAAIEAAGLPVLGCLMREPDLALPERHLGLVQADEAPDREALFARLAARAEAGFDLDRIIALAAPLQLPPHAAPCRLPPPGQRIALARDIAFGFCYPHLLQGWREQGAEVVPFSPLADAPPPEDCDCCWLPGGYPELHAARLAANERFLFGLRRFARTRPVHGECGGYMVLGRALEDADGLLHPMAGLLGHVSSIRRRRLALGYRLARLAADGRRLRGHEFHYASVVEPGSDAAYASLHDARGQDLGRHGGARGRVTGSFFHAIAPDVPA